MVKTYFLLTDRFNQDVQLSKTYSEKVLNNYNELELLLLDFDCFLSSLGFTNEDINLAKEKISKLQPQ